MKSRSSLTLMTWGKEINRNEGNLAQIHDPRFPGNENIYQWDTILVEWMEANVTFSRVRMRVGQNPNLTAIQIYCTSLPLISGPLEKEMRENYTFSKLYLPCSPLSHFPPSEQQKRPKSQTTVYFSGRNSGKTQRWVWPDAAQVLQTGELRSASGRVPQSWGQPKRQAPSPFCLCHSLSKRGRKWLQIHHDLVLQGRC